MWEQVFELSEFDLSFVFVVFCMLVEDVEDDGCLVDDFDFDDVFQGVLLIGCEFGVGDDCVCVDGGDDVFEFLCFVVVEIGGCVWVWVLLEYVVQYYGVCGFCKCDEFVE